MHSIWVYRYRYWDDDRQEQVVSSDMFTLDAIRAGLGTPLLESGMRVRSDHVDANGRLMERALSPTSKA
ncbi:MAG TPA: hypothetical protein VM051_14210 [Usitatibacter sp.]|nr:hypothetical protein [Usitatibacter sp.]